MPRRVSLSSRGLAAAIAERFADDAWHMLDEVVAACGHLVPPEIAVRRYRLRRTQTKAPLSEQVELGRRWVISNALKKMGAEPGGPTDQKRWSRIRLPSGEYGVARGERQHAAKLTESMVREIRLRYALGQGTFKEIGEDYGLSQSAVGQIVHRQTWRHVA